MARSRPRDPRTPKRRVTAETDQSRRSSMIAVSYVGALVLAAVAGGIYLGVRASRPSDASVPPVTADAATTTSRPTTTSAETPREVFQHTCGTCHALKDAGVAAGPLVLGPELDRLRPSRERVVAAIRNGAGSGAMPAGLLAGADVERVAAYVARVAGAG